MQAPSLVLNNAGSRQQVPLRDYLNTRLAPFLKRAITESLDKEAEFPLQWLGECLINQSILYEGNTDPTNIKERFRYTFEAPPPPPAPAQQQLPTETPPAAETAMETDANGISPIAATSETTQQGTAAVNGQSVVEGAGEQRTAEPVAETQESTQPQVAVVATGTEPASGDTEMGGTA